MNSKKIGKALFRSNISKTIIDDSTLQIHIAEEKPEDLLIQISDENLEEKLEKIIKRSNSNKS